MHQNIPSIFHPDHQDKLKKQAVSYRLVAFDLDRTLLRNNGRISEYTRTTLEQLIDRNIHIVIASGRSFYSLPKDVLSISGIQYAITSNGASLNQIDNFEYINHIVFPSHSLLQITAKYLNIYPVELFINGQGYANKAYIESPTSFGAKPSHIPYIQSTRIPVENMEEFIYQHQQEVENLDLIVPSSIVNRKLRDSLSSEYPHLHITSSSDHMVEICHGNAGKGNQLKYLTQLLDIPLKSCITFGDGDNDADLLKISGLGIAMENGSEAAKNAADFLTSSNEHDGVAAALNLIFSLQ